MTYYNFLFNFKSFGDYMLEHWTSLTWHIGCNLRLAFVNSHESTDFPIVCNRKNSSTALTF